jgi:excisionase family DNA binding protein
MPVPRKFEKFDERSVDGRNKCDPVRKTRMPGTGGMSVASEPDMTPQTITTETVLLTPAEVARLFRVDVKTVTRWADTGRLTATRTLGNRRRFREDEVLAVLNGGHNSIT